ncbi:MAG TPA: EI24 domain-containing protein [Azospirillaceae bacterium]|nr:EI24 domain-containing protein [Azospirillaceae bacterium]
MLATALFRALGDLADPAARRVVGRSFALAVLAFVALLYGAGWLLTSTALFSNGWLETVADVAGGVATLALTWFLFPVALMGISGLFLEEVADSVERRRYPALPPPAGSSLRESVAGAVRLVLLAGLLNLLALPIYLLMPGLNLLVFYFLNGYLLGREYLEVVALRRLPAGVVSELRYANRLKLFLAGAMIAFLLTVPVVNLFAPVIATAFMVHVFHGLRPIGYG